jgi:hypothetical protein
MWLILCSAHDAQARWAYEGLRARGLAPLELVTAESLAYGLGWEHRIEGDAATARVRLRDGRALSHDGVRGVLNRLTYVPTNHLAMTPDHDYISQEFTAFFMSWLHALPRPVLNPTTGQGLCGSWRHPSEWVLLAARAGLPAPDYRQSSADAFDEARAERSIFPAGTPLRRAIVVGPRVVGGPDTPPAEIAEGCLRLAGLAGVPLLGVDFAADGAGEWTFAGASPLPELIPGGEPLLDALADALRGGKRARGRSARAWKEAAR